LEQAETRTITASGSIQLNFRVAATEPGEASERIVPLHEDNGDQGAPVPFVTQPLAGRRQTGAGVASEPILNVLVIDDTPEDRGSRSRSAGLHLRRPPMPNRA
jgi:hypothetical protein